jgi:NAD(P)H-dependent flavin oxidoreductase YrpB (nitropropane dioxygenase family)
MINLPKFKIGNLEINLIQGGMGVGISGNKLASAVANEGGAGIIASVGLGALFKYPGSYTKANQDALRDEISQARKKSNGVIGVNIMHALSDYVNLIKTSVEEKVDLIISGAGIPRDLPSYIGEKDIKLIPIVSNVRVTEIIIKSWKRFNKLPDAIIVEGPKAGGHLGYDEEDLKNSSFVSRGLEKILKEVIEVTKKYGNIPVIAAGGLYDGSDIAYFTNKKISAAGVQMATRFVPTLECDASDKFKEEYLRATKENIIIIRSPVGLPGRAIKNKFLERVQNKERDKFKCTFKCLKTCDSIDAPYCIANALIEARDGNFTRGFAFVGANGYKCTPESCLDENKKFISVKTVVQRLSDEYNAAN